MCIFDNFILAGKLSAKVLQSLATYLSVSNNLCRKIVSSLKSPTIVGNNLKTTFAKFFDADFNLSSCEFDNFMFRLLH